MLPEEDKLKQLHYSFKDDALILYQNEIERIDLRLYNALRRIKRYFNPNSKQRYTYRELRALIIEKTEENTTKKAEALDKLNPYIPNHAQLVPPLHTNEATKTKFL